MQVQKDDAASCGRCYLYASRRVADVTASHRPCERGTCRRSCIDLVIDLASTQLRCVAAAQPSLWPVWRLSSWL